MPSRSKQLTTLNPRTASRLLRASRSQDLDGNEMEFLLDALSEGLIKPSEFADFANFAKRKGFFEGFKDGQSIEWTKGDDSSDDEDEDEGRALGRRDLGKKLAYYEEITVVHYKRVRGLVKK
jgi:hypothetical protein